jgi:non-ribosomal peptide synthase protein (TIGR01720 family)
VNLEGHGRETISENLDVTRTIGWYTAQYPVLLNMQNTRDLAYTIKTVKETLRHIPGKGIGYGILRYLTPPGKRPGLTFNREPEISFNYLGQFGQEKSRDEDIARAAGPGSGSPMHPDLETKFAIDINGMIGKNGELRLGFTYNKYEYRDSTIKKLADLYRSNLEEIIDHCTKKEEKELTPADLTYSDLSLDELEELNTQIKELIEIENQGE